VIALDDELDIRNGTICIKIDVEATNLKSSPEPAICFGQMVDMRRSSATAINTRPR